MNIIVAIGEKNEIGCENALLWPIREDLKRFKALTLGHPVIMGRNTWLSLPKRPLPGRLNIVVSGNPGFDPAESINVTPKTESEEDLRLRVSKASSLEEALRIAAEGSEEAPFVIGGGRLYAAALPLAKRLYLTRVEAEAPQADTFFPEINPDEWIEEELSERQVWEDPQSGLGIGYRFQTLVRKG